MASESRAAQLQSKVAELELLLDSCKSKTSVVGGCVPYLLVIAIAFPFFMWAVLYFGKPGFVQRKEGSKMVRDGKKVFMWVVILHFSRVGWIVRLQPVEKVWFVSTILEK